MTHSVDLDDNPMFRAALDRIRVTVLVDDILEILDARFAGAVPHDLRDRLRWLGVEDLRQMLRRCAMAGSIEEACGREAKSP